MSADKTAAERTADAAATLAYSAARYHDAQRVMVSPAIALRATAAELVRVVVGLASDDGIPADEVARSLAVALGGAMRALAHVGRRLSRQLGGAACWACVLRGSR